MLEWVVTGCGGHRVGVRVELGVEAVVMMGVGV